MKVPQYRYILSCFLLISSIVANAQVSDTDVKVAYIYRFTDYIEWQDQNKTTPFTIGVFAEDKLIMEKFRYLAQSRKIKNKKIVIVSVKDLSSLKKEELNILYINSSRNNQIVNIYSSVKGKNTLLVSDNCATKEALMINFLPLKAEGLVRFEINKKNCTNERLIIHPNILLLGGTYVDVQELFHKKELELELERKKLKESKLELKKQKELIMLQDKEIAEREEILLLKNSKIRQQELKLYTNKAELDSLLEEIERKRALLNSKQKELAEHNKQINIQKKSLQKTNDEIKQQKREINTREILIRQQENVLIKKVSQISLQRYMLYTFIFVILLAIGLIYFVYKGLRIKNKANIKLKQYNNEVLAQNEEIKSQREKIKATNENLANANAELEKLSIVASKTNNAVIISDSDGKIEWINEGFTKLFGYEYEELIHEFGKNLAKASALVNIEQKIAECKSTKKTVEYLVQNTTKSGKKLWMHTSLTPILDEAGNVTKLIAIEANITALKKAEQNIQLQKEEIIQQFDKIEAQHDKLEKQNIELEKHRNHLENLVEERTKQLLIAKEKAEESDRLKSAFIANMSHEIRTPLNAIVGFSQLMANTDLSTEKATRFADIIDENTNSLVHLIDDIIDLSKVEAGQLSIKKADCNINAMLDGLKTVYEEKIKKTKREIKLTLKKQKISGKFIINTDKNRVNQVLINLLDNALKFTKEGSIEFGYILDKSKQLKIYVKDTGIGIEESKRTIIFDRFMKIDDDKMKLYRGTGLGLSLSKAIVHDLGGEIWLESKHGKGSVFYFTLPVGDV